MKLKKTNIMVLIIICGYLVEDDYSGEEGDEEIIDINNDGNCSFLLLLLDYVVMDVDDFLERAEDECIYIKLQ